MIVTAIAAVVAAVASLVGTIIKNNREKQIAEEQSRLEALEKLPDWLRPADLMEQEEDDKISLIILAVSIIVILLILGILYVATNVKT